jgi:hypothetical protein
MISRAAVINWSREKSFGCAYTDGVEASQINPAVMNADSVQTRNFILSI